MKNPMLKFGIGVLLVTGGLALMAMSNRQMIAAAECDDCDDETADAPAVDVTTEEVTGD